MCKDLYLKQKQFNQAMFLYESKARYQIFNRSISTGNILLQIFSAYLILPLPLPLSLRILSFVIAYFLADFINGLIHMYMDNNSNYTSIGGPFIASFHLHHKNPRYKKNPLWIVYFNESGSKVWLLPFLLLLVVVTYLNILPNFILHTLCLFGIISSIAEVSHYLCHNSQSKFVRFLGDIGILMTKKHHGRHHAEDNVNYAFLNGLTDPLINLIAKSIYSGYKDGTDKHYANYIGAGTSNRDSIE